MSSSTRWVKRPEGSTWGDFGPDDQRGRINLLTPEKIKQGVAEVAVVAAPDERLGEHGCAFFRMQPGSEPPDMDALRAHLQEAGLTRQKWPEEIRIVDELPRTPSGKIQKFVLRDRAKAL